MPAMLFLPWFTYSRWSNSYWWRRRRRHHAWTYRRFFFIQHQWSSSCCMKQNLPSATFLEKVDPLNPRWRRASFAVITTSGIFYVPPASVDSTLTTQKLHMQHALDPDPAVYSTVRQRPDFVVSLFFSSVPSLAAFLHYLSLFYDDFCSRALIPLFFVSYFIFYSKINSWFFRSNGGGGRTISTNQRQNWAIRLWQLNPTKGLHNDRVALLLWCKT